MGLLPYVRPKYLDDASVLAVGYQLYFYAAGTTNKLDTFTDSSLATPNPNPIILNARGEPDNAGTPIDVYLTPGQSYKVVLATDTDTDPPTSPVWTVDNVTDSGGGGGGGGASGQWLGTDTAVYVNGSSFLLSGVDVTADYHQGRRVWLTGGADRYATITASSFATNTTVTVVDVQDSNGNSAVLDPTMIGSSLSIQRVDADKAIHFRFYPGNEAGVTNYEFPVGDLRRYGAKMDAVDDSTAFTNCVAAVPDGGSLFVPDGIAIVQPNTITKVIHFFGKGTLRMQANANSTFLTISGAAQGTTLRDITIDANRVAQTTEGIALSIITPDVNVDGLHVLNGLENIEVSAATNVQIHNCVIEGHNSDGITVKAAANNVSIQGNIVIGGNYCIRVLGSDEVNIAGNTVTGYVLAGIITQFSTVSPTKITIDGNYVSNKDTTDTGNDIDIQSTAFFTVINNICDKSKDTGISIKRLATDPGPNGFLITNNTIIEPVEQGIFIGEVNSGIIDNNNIQTNGVSKFGIKAFGDGTLGSIVNTIIGTNLIGATLTAAIENLGGAIFNINYYDVTADSSVIVPSGATRVNILAGGGGGGGGGGGDNGSGSGLPGGGGSDTTITYTSTDTTPIVTVITAVGGNGGIQGTSAGTGPGGPLVTSFVTIDGVIIGDTALHGEAGSGTPSGPTNPQPGGRGGGGSYGLGGYDGLTQTAYAGKDGGGGTGGWGQGDSAGGGGGSTSFIHYTIDVTQGEPLDIVIGAGGVGGTPFAGQGTGGAGGGGFARLHFT